MEELKIELPEKIKNNLEKIAKQNGLSLKKLCELILIMFPEDGKFYWGDWHTGGKGARRFIIDWPKFSSPVITLKKEELQ